MDRSPLTGYCGLCHRMVDLSPSGALSEHFRYRDTREFANSFYTGDMKRITCAWSGTDPVPQPREIDDAPGG